MLEHDGIVWFDASVRFRCKGALLQLALTAGRTGVAALVPEFPSTFSYTNGRMFEYIATNITLAQRTPMFGSGLFAIVNTKEIYQGFLQWWVRCSLTEACIAPPHSHLHCPGVKDIFTTDWDNCNNILHYPLQHNQKKPSGI